MSFFTESRIPGMSCSIDPKGRYAQLFYDGHYVGKANQDGTVKMIDDLREFDDPSLTATIQNSEKCVMFFEEKRHVGTVYPINSPQRELSQDKPAEKAPGLLARVASFL